MLRKVFNPVVIFLLAIALTACGGKPGPSGLAPAATPPEGKLTVTSSSAYTDPFGGYHVVGAIQNGTVTSLTSIQLSVEIKDASGTSLIKQDGNVVPTDVFSPLLTTLAPGESSPFEYSFDLSNGTPASYTVTVNGYQSGSVNRASLKVVNAQISDDHKGTLYISGLLVNTQNQWVHLNSLAGSVVGSSEDPLAAASSIVHLTYLAPAGDQDERDRTPFVISFPSPGAGRTDWRVYWDADVSEPPADQPMAVNFTNTYFDQAGAYHIVGYVTNNAQGPLDPFLVAGLQDENGTILDAAYSFYSAAVAPGKSIPFDLSYFGSVNSNPDEAARVRNFTVQLDPGKTTSPTSQTVELTATGEQLNKNGSVWNFTGTVTNTTKQNLVGATVMISIMDGQDNLVASNSAYVLPPVEQVSPGSAISYNISVYLDPTVDSRDFQTETTVIGDIGQ